MILSEISPTELVRLLKGPGIYLPTGPFLFHLRTELPNVVAGIATLYSDFPLVESSDFADFHIELNQPHKLLRCFRPQVSVLVDGNSPSPPLPLAQAFALFEGTLNWCIYSHAHRYFIIHAAAVERHGRTVILPAPPGSGKSTLCAALVHRGWRLLTDELTLIDPNSGLALPLARPISLKDESLEVIRRFAPAVVVGPMSPNTVKGNVAHVAPPTESVHLMATSSRPAWVVFPKYRAKAALSVTTVSKATALMRVADSAVNYSILGTQGFETLSRVMDGVDSYEFEYSDLHEAIAWFDALHVAAVNLEHR